MVTTFDRRHRDGLRVAVILNRYTIDKTRTVTASRLKTLAITPATAVT